MCAFQAELRQAVDAPAPVLADELSGHVHYADASPVALRRPWPDLYGD